jgi:hypothetical protein
MSEYQKEARSLLVELVKLVTTLASATVVLSTTLLDKVFGGHLEVAWLLWASWAALSVSVVAGLFTLGVMVGNLAHGEERATEKTVLWYTRIHFYSFALGLMLLAALVGLNTSDVFGRGHSCPTATSTPSAQTTGIQTSAPL